MAVGRCGQAYVRVGHALAHKAHLPGTRLDSAPPACIADKALEYSGLDSFRSRSTRSLRRYRRRLLYTPKAATHHKRSTQCPRELTQTAQISCSFRLPHWQKERTTPASKQKEAVPPPRRAFPAEVRVLVRVPICRQLMHRCSALCYKFIERGSP